jgi:Leucine-rich repeat (LRR) protein
MKQLRGLTFAGTAVDDLKPLEGMNLTSLSCWRTKVADLEPLRGMKLTNLNIEGTSVSDLSPLEGMPLTSLWFYDTKVSDLSPLRTMKQLKELRCVFNPERDAAILRSITTLEWINDKPAKEFWKEVDEKKP